ncbi:MAG: hypothetical protein R3C49_15355 [Planctomycetaceae bacterium]
MAACCFLSASLTAESADEAVPGANGIPSWVPEKVESRLVTPAELASLPGDAGYQPVSRDEFLKLWRRHELHERLAAMTISRARYTCRLSGLSLLDGTVSLFPDGAANDVPLLSDVTYLGAGSLQQLQLSQEGRSLESATDQKGNLVLLGTSGHAELSGTWRADGKIVGQATVFDLQLPAATISEFVITTSADINLTSPNALVIRSEGTPQQTVWTLLPSTAGAISFSCSSRTENLRNDSIGVVINGDYRYRDYGTQITWTVGIPQSLTAASLQFSTSHRCRIRSVSTASGTAVAWNTSPAPDDSGSLLEVHLPASGSTLNLSIEAVPGDSAQDKLDLPLLTPRYWSASEMSTGGALLLKSATLKVSLPPELAITGVDCDGLLEDSVQFAADGGAVLTLKQLAQQASAGILTAESVPVIEDAVLIIEQNDRSSADAWVQVTARTGVIGRLSWFVPTSWQVTDVQDADGGLPLLYRISSVAAEESNPGPASQLNVTLRTPVTSGGTLRLRIRLQSTGGQLQSEYPQLSNSRHQRRFEYLIPSADRNIRPRPGRSWLSVQEIPVQAPWLPSSATVEAPAIAAGDLPDVFPASIGMNSEEIVVETDYAADVQDGQLTETIRLNLSSPGHLPPETTFRVTRDADLSIAEDPATQPAPSIRMVGRNSRFDEWVLEIPSGAELHNLNLSLVSIRPLEAQQPATLIAFPTARLERGSIQAPTKETGVILQDASGTVMSESRPWPPDPFAPAFQLVRQVENLPRQVVSGSVFSVVDLTPEAVRTDSWYRLLVTGSQDQSIVVSLPETVASPQTFLNGRPIYAEPVENGWRIPLTADDAVAQVDLFASTKRPRTGQRVLNVPVAAFPNSDRSQLNSWMLLPERRIPDPVAASLSLTSVPPLSVLDLLTPMATTEEAPENHADCRHAQRQFAARWRLRSALQQTTCVAMADLPTEPLMLPLHNSGFDRPLLLMAAVCTCIFWLWMTRRLRQMWSAAGVLLLLSLLVPHNRPQLTPLLNGFLTGTLLAGILDLLRRLRRRWKPAVRVVERRHSTTLKNAIAGLLVLLLPSIATTGEPARSSNAAPKILIPEGSLPIIYADRRWFQQLTAGAESSSTDLLVVDAKADVTLRTSTSAAAVVRCRVAVSPAVSTRLTLPLDGVTLVECFLDGQRVYPTRSATGETMIEIPASSLLPITELSEIPSDMPSSLDVESELASQVSGPGMIAKRQLRTVSYTIRLLPMATPDGWRIRLPWPASPVANVELIDPADLVIGTEIADEPRGAGVRSPLGYRYPEVYNRNHVELILHSEAALSNPQSTRTDLSCRMEVQPTQTQMTCDYRLSSDGPQSGAVRIGRNRRFRVKSVETLTGTRLPWAVENEELLVQLEGDAETLRQFRVLLNADTTTGLKQTLPIGELATVNGVRADSVSIVPTTSELFVVDAVSSAGEVLESAPVARPGETLPAGARVGERIFAVPADATTVDVQLAERLSTHEATLNQKAVVSSRYIDWSCRVQIQVTGRPVFRRILNVSPDVQVRKVSASNGEVARLQSWTRTDNQIIIALREATRGELVLDIEGTLNRIQGQDTSLPVIGLPGEVQLFESFLDVASVTERDTFIASLAGTYPASPFDIVQTPIPATPLRLIVTDDHAPLVIRADPARSVVADVTVLVYETAGRLQFCECLTLVSADGPVSVAAGLPTAAAFASSKILIREQAEFSEIRRTKEPALLRASEDEAVPTALVLSDILSLQTESSVPIALPQFDSSVRIRHVQAFDLRPGSGTNETTELPDDVRNIAARALGAVVSDRGTVVDAQLASGSTHVQLQLPASSAVATVPTGSGSCVYARTEHLLNPMSAGLISGVSGLLTFANQPQQSARIRIPEGTILKQVLVNGSPVPAVRAHDQLTVPLITRVSFVELRWLRDQSANSPSGHWPLPDLQLAGKSSLVRMVSRTATIPDEALDFVDDPQVIEDRRSSLTTGLQLIDSEALSDESLVSLSIPLELQNQTADPIWQQLTSESFDAARQLGRFLNSCAAGDRPVRLTGLDQHSTVIIPQSPWPQPLTIIAAIAGIAMTLTVRPRKSATQQNSSHGRTT